VLSGPKSRGSRAGMQPRPHWTTCQRRSM
jgi:hypothetical protein